MNNVGIMSAMELASYISYKYKEIYNNPNKKISPLKLQKSLYFCFAYWGAFVHEGNNTDNREFSNDFNEYLFDDEIQAWVYGPVVPYVYRNSNKIEEYTNDKIFEGNEYVKEFIDGILNDVLKASDFNLVKISHEDKCWINHFHEDDIDHNEEIPKEEIIREYVRQI